MPNDLDQARRLAKLRYIQLFNELNEREQAEIASIRQSMSGRGFNSPMRAGAIVTARRQKIRDLIDGKIDINRNLCTTFPELCSEAALNEMMGEFSSLIENGFSSIQQQFPPASTTGLNDETEKLQLKAYANNKTEIFKTEFGLNIHRGSPSAPEISVMVSGGNALITLGTVYGNVQQAISKVEQHGYQELADRLEQLALTIRGSQELGERRGAYLEQVQFIAEHTTEPEEARKKIGSVVAGIFCSLQVTLQVVANSAQILSVLGPELAKHFGMPWPF